MRERERENKNRTKPKPYTPESSGIKTNFAHKKINNAKKNRTHCFLWAYETQCSPSSHYIYTFMYNQQTVKIQQENTQRNN